ncbi:MAG TPA: hypothetical protein VIS07_12535 [Candidatus Binatia bacterium]
MTRGLTAPLRAATARIARARPRSRTAGSHVAVAIRSSRTTCYGARASSGHGLGRIDRHLRVRTRAQRVRRIELGEGHAHGKALRETHPVERLADAREAVAGGLAVDLVDPRAHALDDAGEGLAGVHVDGDPRTLPRADVAQVGLHEVGAHPPGVRLDQREQLLAALHVRPDADQEIRHVAVGGRRHAGVREVELRGPQVGARELEVGFRGAHRREVAVELLARHELVACEALRALEDLARVEQLGLRARHLAGGSPDAGFVRLALDLEEQIALPHRLVVAHVEVRDRAVDLGRDADDVGAHVGVARVRVAVLVLPGAPSRPRRERSEQEHRRDAEQPLSSASHGRPLSPPP